MEFKANNDLWKIIEQEKQILIDKYNSENEEPCQYTFGVTIYPTHEIWINKEMCLEQKIKTLKHELTHCYIWEFGLYNVPNFNEEMVCDVVSSINDFINEVVDKYKQYIIDRIKDEVENMSKEIEKEIYLNEH